MDIGWILGAGVTVLIAVIGGLLKHVYEDSKTRERVASLEKSNAYLEREVHDIRERWHNFRNGTLKEYARHMHEITKE